MVAIGFGALEDEAGIGPDLTIRIDNIGAVAHQPAGFAKFSVGVDSGDLMEGRQLDDLNTAAGEEGIVADKKRVRPLLALK